MTDLEIGCSCDPEEIAHAVWHEFHKRSKEPYTLDDERLSCGYCNRDNYYNKESEWWKAWERQRTEAVT